MNPLEIIQKVYGDEYQFREKELSLLYEVVKLAALYCVGWQPIETAPDAFKPVLLWGDQDLFIGFHSPGYAPTPDRWVQANTFDEVYPTHWMPLPEPPEGE